MITGMTSTVQLRNGLHGKFIKLINGEADFLIHVWPSYKTMVTLTEE